MKESVIVDVRNFTRRNAYVPAVKRAIAAALLLCGKKGMYEVSVAIVGNAQMRSLKQEWKGESTVTDVLSFPFSDFQEMKGARTQRVAESLGEIVICAPYAERQAKELGISVKDNMITLAAHGAIHLCGIDHEISEREYEKTLAIQKKVLQIVTKLVTA